MSTPQPPWADEAFRLLCEAGAVLSASLEYEDALRELARLVADSFADLCLIDVVEHDGDLVRLATAHRDPALGSAVPVLRRYPPDLGDARDPIAHVMRTGEPLLIPDIDDRWLAGSVAEAEYREALRSLDPCSLVVAPLVSRGEALGALTLLSLDPSRRFDADALRLAVQLARQAAMAVDRARLHEAVEETSQAAMQFMGAMSHELRTPVHVVATFADLLLMGVPVPVPPPARRHAEHIRTAAKHLEEMVTQVLAFARLEAEREVVRKESVELGTLVRETAALVEPLARQKGLGFRVALPEDRVVAWTDPNKLRQILFNLLGNAVKFTESGEVSLTVRSEAEQAIFEVRDTGRGIAEEHLEKIFEPFWQVERESLAELQGTGLGLGIVKRLVHLLDGVVDLQSTPGGGTIFRVTLSLKLERT